MWEYIGFSRSEFHPDTFAVPILVIYLRIIKKYHIEEEKLILGHWHTGFVVKDLDVSIRFYVDGLGMKLIRTFQSKGSAAARVVAYEPVEMKGALLEIADGTIVELLQYIVPSSDDKQSHERNVVGASHIALIVEDIYASLERVTQFGGTKWNDPAETEPGKILSYAQDVDGNWLELAQIDLSINKLT